MRVTLSHETAVALSSRVDFTWHQRFELAPGVYAPGINDIDWLLHVAGIPEDLSGVKALDIGTTNGGAAFALERRGAAYVVATDIYESEWFGFNVLRRLSRSRVEFRKLSVYQLGMLKERFDVVLFWGVLYHLRHPLLALDSVREVTGGTAYIETAVCDHEREDYAEASVVRFYRRAELDGDGSNWFAPSTRTFVDWCASCGYEPTLIRPGPRKAPPGRWSKPRDCRIRLNTGRSPTRSHCPVSRGTSERARLPHVVPLALNIPSR